MTYPVVIIPEPILALQNVTPATPQFILDRPVKPEPEPQPFNQSLLIVESLGALLLGLATAMLIPVLGIAIFLIGAGSIAAHAWLMQAAYRQRKRIYDKGLADYVRQLDLYLQKEKAHEAELAYILSPENIKEFRQMQLLLLLKNTQPQDDDRNSVSIAFNQTTTQTANQAGFAIHLNRYFTGRIYRDLTLFAADLAEPYIAEFAYIDRSLSLYIDIEIDTEIDKPYDDRRDQFLNSKGWLVIRFSEEQLFSHPQSCCKVIAQTIAEVIGDHLELSQFALVPDL